VRAVSTLFNDSFLSYGATFMKVGSVKSASSPYNFPTQSSKVNHCSLLGTFWGVGSTMIVVILIS